MGKGQREFIIACTVLLVAVVTCYFGALRGLIDTWYTDEDYSYGFLIPLISAYLIWERRRLFRSMPFFMHWIGGLFFFLFLLVSMYGILGSSPSAVRPAIPFMLLSIVLFCFGGSALKALWFPLFFLIFMIPLPTTVQAHIGNPLKLLSTKLGAGILDVFGISAFVQGNVIDLGSMKLQVVDACSGLRYILPLLALGVLFAYFFEKRRWKQAVLIAFTIPIAVITNGIRIGATGILAQKFGSGMAEGFFHGFSGWLIFMFAFALLFVVFFLLRLVGRHAPLAASPLGGGEARRSQEERNPGAGEGRFSFTPTVICAAALLVVAGMSFSTGSLSRLVLRDGFAAFPLSIGQWSGQRIRVDPEIVTQSGAEEAISAKYAGSDGKVVSLYIGYRGSPFMESENFFHSPNICLPSSGWDTLDLRGRTIRQVQGLGSIRATEMVIEQMSLKQLVYYWFQTKKATSADVNVNRFQLTLHALRHDNTYDLFVRPITQIYPGETVADAEVRMDRFVRDLTASLTQFLAVELKE